jgi:predicted ATPase/Tfp pilus assembly protein PilF
VLGVARQWPEPEDKHEGRLLVEQRLCWLGVSKAELAARLGVSPGTLTRRLSERYPYDSFSERELDEVIDFLQFNASQAARLRRAHARKRSSDGGPVPAQAGPHASPLVAGSPAVGAVPQRPGDLPRLLTRFIGRQNELSEVRYLMEAARLVTLVGPGGSGKTRLAIELARHLPAGEPASDERGREYVSGVCFVDLSALREGARAAPAVLQALGEAPARGGSPEEELARCLGDRKLVLLLDNGEQVVEACAALAETLLAACPRLQILATSREPLGAAGEAIYRVPALSLPSDRAGSLWDDLATSEAIQLFLDRARLIRPGFGLGEQNAEAVVRICRRLDGLPLALELAAARLQSLSVQELAARLDHALAWLGGGQRLAPERQRTLRAALDWSHALLSDSQRACLRRLAVFRADFCLEAAEAVAGGWPAELAPAPVSGVAADLHELVLKSLALAEERDGRTRYRLLATVREYAQERLDAAGETIEARRRHLDWYTELAERSEQALKGPEQEAWLARWEAERDNLRAALAFSLERSETVESGLRLAIPLINLWELRFDPGEGREWISRLLKRVPNIPDATVGRALHLDGWLAFRAGAYDEARGSMESALRRLREAAHPEEQSALNALASICRFQGDNRAALAYARQGLELCRTRGFARGIASALNEIGSSSFALGEDAAARAALEQSLALCRRIGHWQGVAATLANLQMVQLRQGDLGAARASVEEALALQRRLGNRRGVGLAMNNLGHIARHEGKQAEALLCFEEALRLYSELDYSLGMAQTLWGFAFLVPLEREAARAVRLLGAADTLRERYRYSLWYPVEADAVAFRRALVEHLGEEAFGVAYAAGRSLGLEEALRVATRPPLAIG